MSLLEVITKATANASPAISQSKFPIVLTGDPVLLTMKPRPTESTVLPPPVQRADGWKILPTEDTIIASTSKFSETLDSKLKSPKKFKVQEFIRMLNFYLEENRRLLGIAIGSTPTGEYGDTCGLLEKIGFLMGPKVTGLVMDACFRFKLIRLLQTLILHGLIDHSCSSTLVNNLIEMKRSDLICLSIKYVSDLQSTDILAIIKYFLSPVKSANASMVRREWEEQALMAVNNAADEKLSGKMKGLAKSAAILLMVAHDEFSDEELCLHYLLASKNLDEVIMSSCFSKLNGMEMNGMIQYLGKWLKKYHKFPQVGPCPEASLTFGLQVCDWVPSLDDIAKCLGWLLDEHFSSVVLHSEFHDEMRLLKELVSSLAEEAKLCGAVANVIGNLKTEVVAG